MGDERSDLVKSEQQEGLEARPRTGGDRASDTAGTQYAALDDRGDVTDESTGIADEAGSSYPTSPEERAMHIEDEEGRPPEA